MSIVKLSEIYIDKMTKDDIEGVVEIEEEAYGSTTGQNHLSMMRCQIIWQSTTQQKLPMENSLGMPEHGILLMRDILLQ